MIRKKGLSEFNTDVVELIEAVEWDYSEAKLQEVAQKAHSSICDLLVRKLGHRLTPDQISDVAMAVVGELQKS